VLFTDRVQVKVYRGQHSDPGLPLRALRALRSVNSVGQAIGPHDSIPAPRPASWRGRGRAAASKSRAGAAPAGFAPACRLNFELNTPGLALYVDPMPYWIRAIFDGETVIDSYRPYLLHETGHLPRLLFRHRGDPPQATRAVADARERGAQALRGLTRAASAKRMSR